METFRESDQLTNSAGHHEDRGSRWVLEWIVLEIPSELTTLFVFYFNRYITGDMS